jgi:hypothetical protein
MLKLPLRSPASTAMLATLAVVTGAPPAHAEYKTTTSQALAAHAEWLPYAPPPANGAAAVCLVDTGVDLNPDTASNVIARIALDGGDPSDLSDSKHGTQMAMVMGAPINDWGMVGFWPRAPVISVRASPASGSFSFDAYENGIEACREFHRGTQLAVIELALGGERVPTDEQEAQLAEVLQETRRQGINVVIAAGNSPGPAQQPASSEPALAVGGSDPDGSLCRGSASGSGVDLFAPGCGLDAADSRDGSPLVGSEGTSQASAIAAAALAALRSARPELSPSEAEQILTRATDARQVGPVLNVRAAFALAGASPTMASPSSSRPARPGASQLHPRIAIVRWTRRGIRLRVLAGGRRLSFVLTGFRGPCRVYARRLRGRIVKLRRELTRICVSFSNARRQQPRRSCYSRKDPTNTRSGR